MWNKRHTIVEQNYAKNRDWNSLCDEKGQFFEWALKLAFLVWLSMGDHCKIFKNRPNFEQTLAAQNYNKYLTYVNNFGVKRTAQHRRTEICKKPRQKQFMWRKKTVFWMCTKSSIFGQTVNGGQLENFQKSTEFRTNFSRPILWQILNVCKQFWCQTNGTTS